MLMNARSLPAEGIKPRAGGEYFSACLGGLLIFALLGALLVAQEELLELPLEYALLLLNGLCATYGQVASIHAKSPLHMISFLFCYLVLSLMPMMQIAYKIDPVFRIEYMTLISASASLLFTLCGLVSLSRLNTEALPVEQDKPPRRQFLLLAVLVLGFSVACFALFGRALFSTREEFAFALNGIFSDRAVAGLMLNFLMLVPFFGAAFGLRAAVKARSGLWITGFFFMLLIASIINNPMVNARFKIAGLVFFFIDYFFYGRRIKLLIVVLLAGISLAPLFQIFRYQTADMSAAYENVNYGEKFLSTDYDAFQMAGYTTLTVERLGVSMGANVVGAVLFFVPRAFWPGKPEPSSFEIYRTALKYREVGTDNLSLPLMSEGYLAFSWPGLLAISLLYWYGISALYNASLKNSDSAIFILRAVFTGAVLIFLRGPLITGVTAIIGSFAAALLAWRVFTFNTRQRE